jgi:hypothetical protein
LTTITLGSEALTSRSFSAIQTNITEVYLENTGLRLKNIFTGSGWARSLLNFTNAIGDSYFSFGARGTGQTLTYAFVGPAYDDTWQIWKPGKTGIGSGMIAPTYVFHVAPTSNATAGQTAFFQDATATTGSTKIVIKSGAGQSTSNLQEIQDASGTVKASVSETEQVTPATLKIKNGNKINSFTNAAGQSDGTLAYTLPAALPTVNSVPLVSSAGATTWEVLPQKAQASNTLLTTTNATNVVTLTPTALANYTVGVYLRVVTATTNVTVAISYTDSGGAQVNTVLNVQAIPVGSYSCPLIFLESTASAITVTVTAGTANQVYASASIKEM